MEKEAVEYKEKREEEGEYDEVNACISDWFVYVSGNNSFD